MMKLQGVEIDVEADIDFICQITGVSRDAAALVLRSYALVEILNETTPTAAQTFQSIGAEVAKKHQEVVRNSSR